MTGRLCASYGSLCRVFEWHRWATIVASSGAEDDAAGEAHQRGAEAGVARGIGGAAGGAHETPDLRSGHGSVHVWAAGSPHPRARTGIGVVRLINGAPPRHVRV